MNLPWLHESNAFGKGFCSQFFDLGKFDGKHRFIEIFVSPNQQVLNPSSERIY